VPAYFIAAIEVTDPERYAEYQALAAPSIAEYGGRFMVRGADFEPLEGEWPISRLVMIEFASREQALAWWNSDGYAAATEKRLGAADMRAVLMDGFNA
jgi:uncharacterized protein (DUF1330 family)